MSNSKPLPPFTFDVLCYLNRDQLERFSIVCCPLKNIIDRYFHSKPYRIFDQLYIRGGAYFLCHNGVRWHPDRDDYNHNAEYSFAEMLPYLGPTVRIKETIINVFISNFYSPKYIAEMESIAYLWRDYRISIWNHRYDRIVAEDIQRILNSPTILQCRKLCLYNARFSFKDYQVLYSVKEIELRYNQKVETYYNTHGYNIDEIDLLQQYWHQFLEQPRVKPLVVFRFLRYSNLSRKNIDNLLSRLFKAFSSATVPNAFKIVFAQCKELLTEFRETNNASGEKLELLKGSPVKYPEDDEENGVVYYTLERSSI